MSGHTGLRGSRRLAQRTATVKSKKVKLIRKYTVSARVELEAFASTPIGQLECETPQSHNAFVI